MNESENDSKWIQVFPYGLAYSADRTRPVILFRDKLERRIFPVWSSRLDAHITISQHDWTAHSSPHDLSHRILEKMGVSLKACYFTEVRGHYQYAKLEFSGSKAKGLSDFECRADEALSFCLSGQVVFYCTDEFMEKSRRVDSGLTDLAINMAKDPKWLRNQHPYLN